VSSRASLSRAGDASDCGPCRRTRYLTLAPDWVFEILSPSTEALDRGKKLHHYAREGVAHAWLIEPLRQTLEALSLVSGRWDRLALHEGRARVRVPRFDAIELGSLWI
jgi:Uma2 family endonuclease